MRRSIVASALLAVTVMTSSVTIGDDDQIARQIVQRIRQEQKAGNLKGFGVDLKVVGGVVMMRGHVANARQDQLVQRIAQSTPGVKGIKKNVTVRQAAMVAAKPVSSRRRHASASAMPLPPTPISTASRPAVNPIFSGSGVAKAVALTQGQPRQLAPVPAAPTPVAQAPVAQAPVAQATVPQARAAQPQLAAVPQHRQGRLVPALIAVPVARQQQRRVSQRPVAFAPAAYNVVQSGGAGYGSPTPAYMPTGGAAPARYDHPNLPRYSWPTYAAHPNYGAVTYPKQYSPSAWPYIGPFYPYPQVPLGWRKVTLEWDDGWWMLDFKNKGHR